MWYWRGGTPRDPAHQSFSWSDWKDKLTLQTLELDNDRFDTNALSHPQAGMVYYQIARGNGLSLGTSYLATFLSLRVLGVPGRIRGGAVAERSGHDPGGGGGGR